MKVEPPPTKKEMEDLFAALSHNISQQDYYREEAFFNQWAHYLIGLRRACNKQWLTEAYNEHSSSA